MGGRNFESCGLFAQVVILSGLALAISTLYFGAAWLVIPFIGKYRRYIPDRLLRIITHDSTQQFSRVSINRVEESRIFFLPKNFMSALFGAFYVLAFILSPYWLVPQSTFAKIFTLVVIVVFGAVWSYLVGGDIRVQLSSKNAVAFLIMLIGVFFSQFVRAYFDNPLAR